MKVRKRQERRVPNLLLIFYFTLLIVFLSYFFTSYMAYKRASEEFKALEKALEEKRKEIEEKERETMKLQELINIIDREATSLEAFKESTESTTVTREASE
ncbi:hypothetical protein [Fervidobacterium thailandense]|uniref:Uncharacterized protein n=1 Tax=Fervidobacterium thailandense TaxID=1008305 RepID=A0A1E3G0D2_9BACT|nr:hypothetical protein [Fervidobacterium thailandense]ODN29736.1 hypothetical protein A4H02_09155 [Fervidobacterium thailandense]